MVNVWKWRFLVDVWVEPREVETLPAVVRARVGDLSTGTETYVGSFTEIEQIVEKRLDDDGVTLHRWERS